MPSIWNYIFGPGHQHSDNEKKLIEIIEQQEREAAKQDKRIAILEEHLWKCRHPKPQTKISFDVVFS